MLTNIITRAGQRLVTVKKVLTKRAFSTAALGIMGALAISVTAFTGTASASRDGDCPDPWPYTRVCFWEHINYGGNFYYLNSPVPGVCYGLPAAMNDKTSSLFNRTGYYLYVFKDAGCTNSWGYYSPYGSYDWVGDFSNDLITSFKIQ